MKLPNVMNLVCIIITVHLTEPVKFAILKSYPPAPHLVHTTYLLQNATS